MSELTPEKAREILEKRHIALDGRIVDTLGSLEAEGYLERDAQLRPLITSLEGKLEQHKEWITKLVGALENFDENNLRYACCVCDKGHSGTDCECPAWIEFLNKKKEALTLAHKAGFGKKEAP